MDFNLLRDLGILLLKFSHSYGNWEPETIYIYLDENNKPETKDLKIQTWNDSNRNTCVYNKNGIFLAILLL